MSKSSNMKSRLAELLEELRREIPSPKEGLPQEVFYFVSQLTPLINVDLLVKNKAGQTLLTWRHDRFYGPAWHIPGGIIRFKETIEDRIRKVAESELGCSVRFAPEPINVRGLINKERDVRGHFISLLFLCEATSEPSPQKKHAAEIPEQGHWAWHDGAPTNLLSVHESFRKFIDETRPL